VVSGPDRRTIHYGCPVLTRAVQEPEGGGIAVEPAHGAREGLEDDAALAQTVAAQEDEQVEIAAGEGLDDLFQVGVGRDANA
jgi:hypothetical protein